MVLIGFMGSGKSSVGRILAARLAWDFVDTDALVEAREGEPVPEIFRARGEKEFRRLENEVLESLRARRRVVIASGGGAPLQPANAAFFASPGTAVFYLRVPLAAALERTRGSRDRPLLAQGEDAVRALYESRLAIYESMGRGVETGGREPAAVAGEILALLGSLRNPRASSGPGGSGPQAP